MGATAPGDDLLATAAGVGEDSARAIAFAVRAGAELPLPGSGRTAQRWRTLGDVARIGLTAARVLEAHSDALAILAEAGHTAPATGAWGVFAAEAPDVRLVATGTGDEDATGDADGDDVRLTGTKPWCSLGGLLDHALVTARSADGTRRGLYAVALRQPGVSARPVQQWESRGLRGVPSTAVDFDDVPARAVGGPGWYLTRPGFAWGGAGVAACWYGGALGLADAVGRKAADHDGEIMAMHVGAVDVALTAARCVLADAAASIDAGHADGDAGALLALRVRGVVADAAERVLHTTAHALGPAPLAFDAAHAARVADLSMYVRQHHGERDLASLGAAVLAADR